MPHHEAFLAGGEGGDRLVVFFPPGAGLDQPHDPLRQFRGLLFVLVRELAHLIFSLPQAQLAGHLVANELRLADDDLVVLDGGLQAQRGESGGESGAEFLIFDIEGRDGSARGLVEGRQVVRLERNRNCR